MKIAALLIAPAMLMMCNPARASEKWDFGRFDYGSLIDTQPAGATGWQCDDASCSFTDGEVEYVTYEGEVVVKTFTVLPGNVKQIPFGLDYAQSPHDMLAALSQRTGETFLCDTQATNPNIAPGHLYCSAEVEVDDPGTYLFVEFDQDQKLMSLKLWTQVD